MDVRLITLLLSTTSFRLDFEFVIYYLVYEVMYYLSHPTMVYSMFDFSNFL